MLGNGTLFGIETASSDAVQPAASKFLSAKTIEGARAQLGRLIQANPSGNWKAVADVGHFDFRWSEEHKELVPAQFPDANPYGVFASGGERWVVDAASNTLDQVRPNGSVSVVAFIPNPAVSDAVPTCLDRGPDGAFYIGQLTGFGNGPGKANVWRVVPGQTPEVWASGLTAITGCGFGSDGKFYATEFSTNGWESGGPGTGAVVQVPAHGTSPTPIASNLSFPGGFAAGPDGALYVSNWSVAPADSGGGPTGEVVRITP
jgi:sugar lactone lactonase YvrE